MAQFGVLALPPLLSCSGGNYAMQFRSDISGKHSTRSVAAVVAHANDVHSNIAATCSALFGGAASTSEPPLSPQLVPPLAPAAPRDDDTEERLRQIRLDVLMRKPRPRQPRPLQAYKVRRAARRARADPESTIKFKKCRLIKKSKCFKLVRPTPQAQKVINTANRYLRRAKADAAAAAVESTQSQSRRRWQSLRPTNEALRRHYRALPAPIVQSRTRRRPRRGAAEASSSSKKQSRSGGKKGSDIASSDPPIAPNPRIATFGRRQIAQHDQPYYLMRRLSTVSTAARATPAHNQAQAPARDPSQCSQ